MKDFKDELITAAITCLKCGNDKFYVGQGTYYTAIKCTECDLEKTIHEG